MKLNGIAVVFYIVVVLFDFQTAYAGPSAACWSKCVRAYKQYLKYAIPSGAVFGAAEGLHILENFAQEEERKLPKVLNNGSRVTINLYRTPGMIKSAIVVGAGVGAGVTTGAIPAVYALAKLYKHCFANQTPNGANPNDLNGSDALEGSVPSLGPSFICDDEGCTVEGCPNIDDDTESKNS